jgi:hypothetical protein
MQDGRLFVIRPGAEPNNVVPSGEIWRVNPQDAALIRDLVFPIKGIEPGNLPQGPAQLADGRLAFAFTNTSATDYRGRGLYFVSLNDRLLQRVNGLPPTAEGPSFNVRITWSPDGAGALVQDGNSGTLLYVPTDGSPLYDLRPVVGEAFGFTWLQRP